MQHIQHFLHANPTAVPVIVLVVSELVFGAIANNFFTPFNMTLIVQQVTIIGILGIAMTLIILTAGIDLSVAAIMVLSTVVMGGLGVNLGNPLGHRRADRARLRHPLRRHEWGAGHALPPAAVHRHPRHLRGRERGGTSLFGGRGSIIGTLVRALIVGVFRSGLNLSGVDVLWQQFPVGALIIIAVAIDQWLRKVSS